MKRYGDKKLLKIGELAAQCDVSPRTIDYYTKLGLIRPAARSRTNYRLYGIETLEQLKRIEYLKQQKYTLEEIKKQLLSLKKGASEDAVANRLASVQLHMVQLEREVKELAPLLQQLKQLKPNQAKILLKHLSPQTAACIDALLLLLG